MTETEFRLNIYREAKDKLLAALENKSPNSVVRDSARQFLIASSRLGVAEARAENRRMIKAKERRAKKYEYNTESNVGCEVKE